MCVGRVCVSKGQRKTYRGCFSPLPCLLHGLGSLGLTVSSSHLTRPHKPYKFHINIYKYKPMEQAELSLLIIPVALSMLHLGMFKAAHTSMIALLKL